MSRGSKLPAMPPLTGCLVCGEAHDAGDCPHGRDIIAGDVRLYRKANAAQLRRDARLAADRRMALTLASIPVSTGSYDDRMAASVGDEVAAQLRATRFYRGAV